MGQPVEGADRELRLPDRQSVNAHVRLNLQPLIGQRLSVFADVLNVLARRTVQGIGNEDGRNFGDVTSRMEPFRVRFGMEYKF